jgi:IS5 family transposase
MRQASFADLAFDTKKKTTKRERFLAEMDAVIPWPRLLALIEPHYPKGERGRRPIGLERMLRVYFVQQWYALSDPLVEESLYDSDALRRFVGLRLGHDAVPDESTVLQFRRLLERHELTERLFAEVAVLLSERGLLMSQGTIVDATIIHAPSSTKNEEGKRDPEMTQTRKGNQYYFGMKAHIGVDARSGLAHRLTTTTASTADVRVMETLLHGAEREVYGDKGYVSEARRCAFKARGGRRWGVARRAKPGQPLSDADRERNRRLSSIRSKVEHVFRVVKRQFGYAKVRYRGLAKNTAQLFTLFALSNLYLARRQLVTTG